jgi:hypothetical protein
VGYYSFIAFAKQPVSIQNPPILLGEGVNTFTAVTDDIDGLKALLKNEGVDLREVHRLDGLDPVPPESILLPGEDPAEVLDLLLGAGYATKTEGS